MKDLDSQIAKWRSRMLAAGITTPIPLDELEVHLREDVERQIQEGVGAQEAFDAAVSRIGQPRALQAEFAKTSQVMTAKERKLTWLLCDICLVLDLLLLPLALFLVNRFATPPPPLLAQMLAALTWLLLYGNVWGLRYTCRFLPVIPGKRKRLCAGLLIGALGCLGTAVLWRLIPEHPGLPGLSIAVWALIPTVLGLTLYIGLEEIAYRKAVGLQYN